MSLPLCVVISKLRWLATLRRQNLITQARFVAAVKGLVVDK